MSRPMKDYRRPKSLGLRPPEVPQQNYLSTAYGNNSYENGNEEHYASIPDIFSTFPKETIRQEHEGKQSHCNPLALFLVLIVAVTALVLMVLITLGYLGPKCPCTEGEIHILKMIRKCFVVSLGFSGVSFIDTITQRI